MCETCGCSTQGSPRIVEVQQALLKKNEDQAARNREHIERLGACGINLISAPGSGKTTLLEQTIDALGRSMRIGVIEGDLETERDAERIRARGASAVQLTTGGACHLDAPLVHRGLHRLEDEADGQGFDLGCIENVGNLVCPSAFDLGEHRRVVLVSVPEGSDKPAKYPAPFQKADLFLITKIDLLPYFDFDPDEAENQARQINPRIQVIRLCAVSGEGMQEWFDWLRLLLAQRDNLASALPDRGSAR
jgi:hydrogenase nickel incorporation protein HypB